MKRKYNLFFGMALIGALTALSACSADNDLLQSNAKKNVYTLSVNAAKNTTDNKVQSKALRLDGTTLNGYWATGEEVTVKKGSETCGTITPQTVGTGSTRLSGTLTITNVAIDDELVLYYPLKNKTYSAQVGTIDDISNNYNFAIDTVKVTAIDNEKQELTTSDATFNPQQAVCEFNFTDNSGNPLTVSEVKIMATSGKLTDGPITVTPAAGGATKIDVAMNNTSGAIDNYTFIAKVGSDNYLGTKNANLVNGKYYSTTIALSPLYDLSTGSIITNAGEKKAIYCSTASTTNIIRIGSGSTVIIYNINMSNSDACPITAVANANLVLAGKNTVVSTATGEPGVRLPDDENSTLTISGGGSLDVTGGQYSAGIGAQPLNSVKGGGKGNLEIKSGTIKATGGEDGAGIGSGYASYTYTTSCGNITISGGTVTATGGENGAGIGSGFVGDTSATTSSTCGNITISGGTVTATGGQNGAGIGSGALLLNNGTSSCGSITISGGIIKTFAGREGTGIGTGLLGICGDIQISNSTVTVTGNSDSYACIGMPGGGTTGNVKISSDEQHKVICEKNGATWYIYISDGKTITINEDGEYGTAVNTQWW